MASFLPQEGTVAAGAAGETTGEKASLTGARSRRRSKSSARYVLSGERGSENASTPAGTRDKREQMRLSRQESIMSLLSAYQMDPQTRCSKILTTPPSGAFAFATANRDHASFHCRQLSSESASSWFQQASGHHHHRARTSSTRYNQEVSQMSLLSDISGETNQSSENSKYAAVPTTKASGHRDNDDPRMSLGSKRSHASNDMSTCPSCSSRSAEGTPREIDPDDEEEPSLSYHPACDKGDEPKHFIKQKQQLRGSSTTREEGKTEMTEGHCHGGYYSLSHVRTTGRRVSVRDAKEPHCEQKRLGASLGGGDVAGTDDYVVDQPRIDELKLDLNLALRLLMEAEREHQLTQDALRTSTEENEVLVMEIQDVIDETKDLRLKLSRKEEQNQQLDTKVAELQQERDTIAEQFDEQLSQGLLTREEVQEQIDLMQAEERSKLRVVVAELRRMEEDHQKLTKEKDAMELEILRLRSWIKSGRRSADGMNTSNWLSNKFRFSSTTSSEVQNEKTMTNHRTMSMAMTPGGSSPDGKTNSPLYRQRTMSMIDAGSPTRGVRILDPKLLKSEGYLYPELDICEESESTNLAIHSAGILKPVVKFDLQSPQTPNTPKSPSSSRTLRPYNAEDTIKSFKRLPFDKRVSFDENENAFISNEEGIEGEKDYAEVDDDVSIALESINDNETKMNDDEKQQGENCNDSDFENSKVNTERRTIASVTVDFSDSKLYVVKDIENSESCEKEKEEFTHSTSAHVTSDISGMNSDASFNRDNELQDQDDEDQPMMLSIPLSDEIPSGNHEHYRTVDLCRQDNDGNPKKSIPECDKDELDALNKHVFFRGREGYKNGVKESSGTERNLSQNSTASVASSITKSQGRALLDSRSLGGLLRSSGDNNCNAVEQHRGRRLRSGFKKRDNVDQRRNLLSQSAHGALQRLKRGDSGRNNVANQPSTGFFRKFRN